MNRDENLTITRPLAIAHSERENEHGLGLTRDDIATREYNAKREAEDNAEYLANFGTLVRKW